MLFEGATPSAPTTSRLPEFLAVVLCGPGQDLYPLTGTDGAAPKATLPVANRPVIDYVLNWIEESGLSRALVLAAESEKHQISSALRGRKTEAKFALQTDLECLDDDEFVAGGTAGTLRWAVRKGLIRTAFVVLPCDLFFAAASRADKRSLASLIDRHRVDQNLVTSLFYERAATGLDAKEAPALVLTSTDPRTGRLLNIQDLDDLGSDITIRTSMLRRFPAAVLSTSLLPAHVFVCSHRVLALLTAFPTMDSLKDEFVPWLAKSQWQKGLLEKTAEADSNLSAAPDSQIHALSRSTTNPLALPALSSALEDPFAQPDPNPPRSSRPPIRPYEPSMGGGGFSFLDTFSAPPSLARLPESLLSRAGASGTLQGTERDNLIAKEEMRLKHLACVAVVWRKDQGFCARGNSVATYAEMNRVALKAHAASGAPPTHHANAPSNAQISPDSIVGANVVVGERASVKRSCVGKGVNIARGAKINGCVLMENAVVGENAKLDNCIVCTGARVGDRAQLKDCQISADYIVEAEATAKGEQFVPMQME